MNPAFNRSATDEQEVTDIARALAQWYAAQSSIRRLWASEDRDALIVFVALEPTADGDDTLVVWLAKNRDWASDLRLVTHREMQLKLVVSDVFEEPHVVTDAALIAEVSWRESWITS
jgi:hypothetical protein